MDKLNNGVHTAMGGRSGGVGHNKTVERFLLKGRRSKSTDDLSHNSRNVEFALLICRLFLISHSALCLKINLKGFLTFYKFKCFLFTLDSLLT